MMGTKSALLSVVGAFTLMLPQASSARTISIPFDPTHFTHPLTINNPYLPLVPGTTLVYRSNTPDGCEETRVTVTNGTKAIAAGVTARPVHDEVTLGATCTGPKTLIEDTIDWYAQDDTGNVWYLGEDTKECGENGCVKGSGSWEAGADVSHSGTLGVAGIIMVDQPRQGDQYQQEFYEGFAQDVAAVLGTDVDVTLSRPDALQPRVFHHCLQTKEKSTLEPASTAHKFYCRDIGLVAEEDLSRGRVRAELIDPGALRLEFRTVR
jgi:hypothetical protein